jgi:hypothetical protein
VLENVHLYFERGRPSRFCSSGSSSSSKGSSRSTICRKSRAVSCRSERRADAVILGSRR